MQRSRTLTFGAASFVLLGVSALTFLLTQISNRRVTFGSQSFYELSARFTNIGDLKVGAHVSMSGVDIGRVQRIDFDPMEQRAVVLMRLSSAFDHIPNDSAASIYTQGLLGGKFISVTNGGSSEYLKDRDLFARTQSAVVLENMISQLLAHYLNAQDGTAKDGQPRPQ